MGAFLHTLVAEKGSPVEGGFYGSEELAVSHDLPFLHGAASFGSVVAVDSPFSDRRVVGAVVLRPLDCESGFPRVGVADRYNVAKKAEGSRGCFRVAAQFQGYVGSHLVSQDCVVENDYKRCFRSHGAPPLFCCPSLLKQLYRSL
jgi:hypothetical protein